MMRQLTVVLIAAWRRTALPTPGAVRSCNGFAPLLQHRAVGHLLRQRMLEDVLAPRETPAARRETLCAAGRKEGDTVRLQAG